VRLGKMNDSHRKLQAEILKEMQKFKDTNGDSELNKEFVNIALRKGLPAKHPLIQKVKLEMGCK
jgi:hypothetical protein